MKYLLTVIIALIILAIFYILPIFLFADKEPLSRKCHVETFATIETYGYSKAPHITGCSYEEKKVTLQQWCLDYPQEKVC